MADGGKKPTKGRARRILLSLLGGAALIAVIWMGFILFGNKYKSNAMEMKVNAAVAQRLASIILSDYQDNWVRVETEQLGLNASNVLVSTDDAQQVVKWRKEFFDSNGATKMLEQLMADMETNIGSMKLTPAKYRDTRDNFKTAYEQLQQLVQLTLQPGDSLMEMASKTESLMNAIENSLSPTDFHFWVNQADINSKASDVAAKISDKKIAESLVSGSGQRVNNALNMLKYKKMGFKELPKGKGVLFHELKAGKGPKPKDDTNVSLHYEGKLMDGTVFDSSYKRGQPAAMRPSQTVPGFWHSLLNMPVGAKWEIYIPSDQAYGERAAGAVKPNSDLFFTIEVLGIEN